MCCFFFACFSQKHIHEHARETNHVIAFDTTFGYVYCFVCKDYVYDSEFEEIAPGSGTKQINDLCCEKYTCVLQHKHTFGICGSTQHVSSVIKKKSGGKEFQLFKLSNSFLGLRGIINFKNTCYIGSTIQVLFHAPLFRNYLLADKHKCTTKDCLLKTMSIAAREFYSEEMVPYNPNYFYFKIFEKFKQFAKSDYQDSIEILSKLIENLHCDEKLQNGAENGYNNNSNIEADNNPLCNCIIGKLFECSVKYHVRDELKEKNLPSIFNYFLESNAQKGHAEINGYQNNIDEDTNNVSKLRKKKKTKNANIVMELEELNWGILDHENVSEIKTADLRLPIIITFVLVPSVANHEKGITIKYPEVIDARKYLSIKPFIQRNDLSEDFLYYLFAVQTYFGKRDSGHYKAYIKQHKNWYQCNDDKVTRYNKDILDFESNLHEDLEGKDKERIAAVFYHKKVINYRDP